MANEYASPRSKAPDFDHWESPETRIRWERGLALIAGMIGVVIVFLLLIATIPLAPKSDSAPVTGRQQVPQAVAPAQALAQGQAAPAVTATAPAQATPAPATGELRLSALSRATPNVRRGPSLDAQIAFQLRPQQRVDVIGRSADAQWLQVLNPENARERLWVSADMLDVTGDPRTLPQAP
ncbi:MAG: SH3 domain-containing protein [Dehalococcoidia bacterium]